MADSNKGARLRAAAAEAVDAVVSSGRSLDAALGVAESRIAPDDRALLRMLCYGSLRHHWQLQAWIDRLLDRPLKKRDSVINALLAVGLYQISETRIPDHAAVSLTVEAARILKRPKHAGLLNAILRRFMREDLANQAPTTPTARFNHPEWFIAALQRDWPSDWQAILGANNEQGPMCLRVNRRHCSLEGYQRRLQDVDLEVFALQGFEQALCLTEPVQVSELPGFAEGDVSVQDAAAQIAAPWLAGLATGRVLDACAAPGGKAAHLLEIAGASIDLTCVDIDASRIRRVHENLDRIGVAATVCQGDASKPEEWWDKREFDGILLDAPCSASGVIRRHPDIKLLRRESDLDALARRQSAILRALWRLLVPGGYLLYVTCSVLSIENEAVVGAFLGETPDARENKMLQNNNIRDVMRRKPSGYQVLPGTAGMDGFYYACLEKVA